MFWTKKKSRSTFLQNNIMGVTACVKHVSHKNLLCFCVGPSGCVWRQVPVTIFYWVSTEVHGAIRLGTPMDFIDISRSITCVHHTGVPTKPKKHKYIRDIGHMKNIRIPFHGNLIPFCHTPYYFHMLNFSFHLSKSNFHFPVWSHIKSNTRSRKSKKIKKTMFFSNDWNFPP